MKWEQKLSYGELFMDKTSGKETLRHKIWDFINHLKSYNEHPDAPCKFLGLPN